MYKKMGWLIGMSALVWGIVVSLSLNAAYAQEEKKKDLEGYYDDTLYTKDRFYASDTNGDGYLDKKELESAQKGFEEYRDTDRFQHADTDNDGQISFDEAKAEKKWEKQHRGNLESRGREDVKGAIGEGATRRKADYFHEYSQDNPELSKELEGIYKEHPDWRDNMWGDEQRMKYVLDNSEKYPNASDKIFDYADKYPNATEAAWSHPYRSKWAAEKGAQHEKATKALHRKAVDRPGIGKEATKKAWQNPQRSQRAIGAAERNPAKAKAAYNNPKAARQQYKAKRGK